MAYQFQPEVIDNYLRRGLLDPGLEPWQSAGEDPYQALAPAPSSGGYGGTIEGSAYPDPLTTFSAYNPSVGAAPVAATPIAPQVPRTSAVDAWKNIGDALMMMGGPQGRQMLQQQQTHDLAMQQGQGQLQQNQIDLAKGQNDLSDHAIARMGTAAPILANAYAQGGAPAMAAAWDQWAPILGITPDKIASMHQLIQNAPAETLKQIQAMLPADKATYSNTPIYIKNNQTGEVVPFQTSSAGGGAPVALPDGYSLAASPVQQANITHQKRNEAIAAYKTLHPAALAMPAGWTPEVIDTMAQQVRANPYLIRSVPKGVQAQVLARISQLGDPHDIAGQAAAFKSDQGSLSFLTKQTDSLVAAQKEAQANGKLVLQALGPGAAQTGSPVFNRWVQAGRQATGDPDVTSLNRAIHDYTGVAAKIVERSTGSVKAAGVAAQKQLDEDMNKANTPAQIIAAMHQFDMAIANSRQGNEAQIATIRQRMRPQGPPSSAPRPAPAASGGWKIIGIH